MPTRTAKGEAPGRRGRDPDRRAAILDAGDRVFAERGFHDSSMDEIAEQVGVAKPVLYRHFGSKEGLYVACLERAGLDLMQRLRDAIAPQRSRDQLRASVQAFFGFVDERRDAWLVLHREALGGAGPVAERLADINTRVASMVAQLFITTAEERSIAPMDPARAEALAHAIVGAGQALATHWVLNPGPDRDTVAKELVDLVWPGFERLAKA